MLTDPRLIYYVYILFDYLGIPRYVGKGKGRRWLAHDKANDPNNERKNVFVRETIRILGEVPKIKIRENISEAEALTLEAVFIKTLKRWPRGPLLNLTDKRNGPTSETIKAWHASRTPAERSASAKKGVATYVRNTSPEKRFKQASKRALSVGRDVLSQRMKDIRNSQSQEERRDIARKAGLASAAAVPREQRDAALAKGRVKFWSNLTSEQRREHTKKSGLAKFTKEQLSDCGKKGVAVANANRTPEQRIALAGKAATARFAKMTPEERVALAKKAGIAGQAANALRSPESWSESASKAWQTRIANGTTETPTKGSVWINNGLINKRVSVDEIPEGWARGIKRASPKEHPQ